MLCATTVQLSPLMRTALPLGARPVGRSACRVAVPLVGAAPTFTAVAFTTPLEPALRFVGMELDESFQADAGEAEATGAKSAAIAIRATAGAQEWIGRGIIG